MENLIFPEFAALELLSLTYFNCKSSSNIRKLLLKLGRLLGDFGLMLLAPVQIITSSNPCTPQKIMNFLSWLSERLFIEFSAGVTSKICEASGVSMLVSKIVLAISNSEFYF